MPSFPDSTIVITGMGVVSSIGLTLDSFWQSLLAGNSHFAALQREGRGCADFIGAEIKDFVAPESFNKHRFREVSLSAQVAVATLEQAWSQANLETCDSASIGLIVGGSNFTQREKWLLQKKYSDRPAFVRPSYAVNFLDSDLCGICTQVFGIHGFAHTVGGASASGQLAFIQAVNAVRSRQVQACIALGALSDISELELQAFQSAGAMASRDYFDDPAIASRPFDARRKGFVFGENCGALVVESLASARNRGVQPIAKVAGTAVLMDGNRDANPSLNGEVNTIRKALLQAQWTPEDIHYVNPHASGSILGDEIELQAIQEAGLNGAWINTTKSISGHGLSAAGAIELIATALQMRHQILHPSLNLHDPISKCHWVQGAAQEQDIRKSLSISLGFGGINTVVCMEKMD